MIKFTKALTGLEFTGVHFKYSQTTTTSEQWTLTVKFQLILTTEISKKLLKDLSSRRYITFIVMKLCRLFYANNFSQDSNLFG